MVLKRRVATAIALVTGALALAGCSAPVAETVGAKLPDLSEYGYAEFACAEGTTFGETFQAPEEPYRAQCWEGTQNDPFVWVADDLRTSVSQETGGVDASAQACPDDVLNEVSGIACRAVYVGKEGDEVLVRIIVVLSDIEAVMAKLPEEPTSDDVIQSLYGADVEVLIGTEPVQRVDTAS